MNYTTHLANKLLDIISEFLEQCLIESQCQLNVRNIFAYNINNKQINCYLT